MKIGFFEKVLIQNCRSFPALNGQSAVMLGISEENGFVYGYSISVDGEDELYFVKTDEVIGTGEFVDRSVFYDDADRIRVRVDEDGLGHIVEEES